MAKKDNKNKAKKIYRLVILEDESLKERFSLLLTKLNVFTYGGAIVILLGVITTLLLIYTPLNSLLPQRSNLRLKTAIAENTLLIDSLKREIQIRDNYFENFQNIVTNKNIEKLEADTIQHNILSSSEKDSINKLLLEQLNQLQAGLNSENYEISEGNFETPVQNAVVTNEFNVAKEHFGIDLAASENTPILSVQKGTVILATWTMNEGYVIEIQHPNNILSIYKHCGELLKKEGESVEASEPIALVGNTSENSTGSHLHFELWENGVPINPRKYINF